MISGVFGLTGSGKSTFLAWCANKALHDKPIYVGSFPQRTYLTDNNIYERVYTNFECPGCYKLDFEKLGKVEYSHCLILIDEIMLLCDSRNYMNFGENLKYFFSHHRKYNVDIIWCGQSYMDTDVKVRRLTKQYCFITSSRFQRSKVMPIQKILEVNEFGQIVEGFSPASFWGSTFINRKSVYHLFDSMERRTLRPFCPSLWAAPVPDKQSMLIRFANKIKKNLAMLAMRVKDRSARERSARKGDESQADFATVEHE